MNKKYKTLISDTLLFSIGYASSRLILFLLMPLYTSMLSAENYGVAETLNSYSELIVPVLTICVSEAILRFTIDQIDERVEIFSFGLKIVTIGSLITLGCFILVNLVFDYKYLYILYLIVIVNSYLQICRFFIRGLGNNKNFAMHGVMNSFLLAIFGIIFLVILKLGILGYLLAIIVSNLITLVSIFITNKLYLFIGRNNLYELKKEMRSYCLPFVPNTISWWVNTCASRTILLMYDTASVGLFVAAGKLPAIINILSTVFQQAWIYSSAKAYGDEDKEDYYSNVFEGYSMFLNILCSITFIVLPLIGKLLFRGDFISAWYYSPLLLISAMLGCYSSFFSGIFSASKKSHILMISTMAGAVVNIIVLVFTIYFIGIYSAIVASTISYATIVVIRINASQKIVKIKIKKWNNLLSIAILILQAISISFFKCYYFSMQFGCMLIICIIYRKNMNILFKLLYYRIQNFISNKFR